MIEILTKKQLEDASICYKKKCSECAANKAEIMTDDCIELLAKTALTLYEMLKRLESVLSKDSHALYLEEKTHKLLKEITNLIKIMGG